MKGESVQYEVAPAQGIQGQDTRSGLKTVSPRPDLVSAASKGLTLDSKKPALRVPHKPTEIKIPPAQATQPPRN